LLCDHYRMVLRLFIRSLVQQQADVLVTEKGSVGARRAIAGHFIVLNSLSGCDDRGITNVNVLYVPDQITSFLNDSLHAFAFLPFRFFTRALENLLESCRLSLGDLQMLRKRVF